MDEESRATIDYLRSLPAGAAVRWSSHHVSRRQPWTTKWVDVRIEDAEGPRMNWVWTIIGPDDPEGTDLQTLWQFVVDYDLDVHVVRDPAGGPANEWPCRRGDPVPERIRKGDPPLAERIGGRDGVLGGWTVEAIERALARWATTHAGRPDLRFVWDPDAEPYEAIRRAAERARAIDRGAPVWDLGDGLIAAEGFVEDVLATDPDAWPEIVEAARDARRRWLGGGQRPEEGGAGSR